VDFLYYILMQGAEAGKQAAGEAKEAPAEGSPFSLLFLFVILFGIMYVFLILPQKRREKKHRALLSELKKNDHVVTAGGVHGVVMSVKEGSAVLRIDEAKDVKISVALSSISQVLKKEDQGAD